MKETVLSAKTSGTARKRFEVIVEVIKKKHPKNFFRFFFTPCFFYFLGTCSVFAERVTYNYIHIYMDTNTDHYPACLHTRVTKNTAMAGFFTPYPDNTLYIYKRQLQLIDSIRVFKHPLLLLLFFVVVFQLTKHTAMAAF